MRRFIHRPSPAMIVACIALLVALGGTSVAAVSQLARNSVGTAQLRNNAVTAPKIANNAVTAPKIRDNAVVRRKIANNAVTSAQVQGGSLLATDFAEGQIPQGPPGPAGPAGPQGPAGPGARWALFRPDGGIVVQSGGISLTAKPGAGQYIVNFGSSVAGKLIVVSSGLANDINFRGVVSAGVCGGGAEGSACPTGNDVNHVRVFTDNPGETATQDHSFYVAVIG